MNPENYIDASPQAKPADSFGDKVWRELQLTGVGLAAVPGAAVTEISEKPVETAAKALTAAGLSMALGYAYSKTGPLGGIARAAGIGLGVTAIGDFGRNIAPTMGAYADNWNSAANWDANAATMQKSFAPFVFDSALNIGAGGLGMYGGVKLARSFQFEPMLPELTKKGYLPAGIHPATWQEFATRYGTTPRRADMVANMEYLLQQAKQAGGDKVYVGGSFVTSKPTPGDFDMTWKISGERIGQLRKTNPILVDRTMQAEKLGGQLMVTYPNSPGNGVLGQLMRNMRERPALDVGVVEIDLGTLPSNTSYRVRSWLGRAGIKEIPKLD